MAPHNFAELLKQSMGLDAASIGVSAIERAVRERQVACKLDDREAYWNCVRTSDAELQALVELVVVPETWFFRDPEALTALSRVVLSRLAGAAGEPDRVVRVLSLPCSTGEEPYSMAMALLDAAVPAQMFRVHAVDISHRALAAARLGLYRKVSFRGQDLEYRRRFFEPTAAGFRVFDSVREQVEFRHGNLLRPASLPGAGTYDAVFCRNVLIYFDRATQERAIAALTSLLTADGLLFVGPAEAPVLLNHGLESARMPKAHAFRKGGKAVKPPRRSRQLPALVMLPRRAPAARQIPGTDTEPPVPAQAQSTGAAEGLESGRQLANQGRFVEAEKLCEDHVRRHGASVEVFYLLGLVRDAIGHQADAAAAYRKALYLDPCHHETLVHLALLMDTQNNRAEAQLLRTRAQRATRQGSAS
jgi:chemotaxis protein methyltransferase WspC